MVSYVAHKEVFEVIEEVSKESSRAKKIDLLQEYASPALKDLLRGTYDDVVQWALPPGDPPYTPAEESSVPSSFKRQHKQFAYFAKGIPKYANLRPLKRETMFVNFLESIHPKDAELILLMKEKKNLGKGITKKLVQEAFPNLIMK